MPTKHYILLLFICYKLCYISFAQTDVPLMTERIKTMRDDTLKLSALHKLIEETDDKSSWIPYNDQMGKLALQLFATTTDAQIKKRAELAYAWHLNNTSLYPSLNDLNKFDNLKKSLTISNKYNNELLLLDIYVNLSNAYLIFGQKNKALTYALQGLQLAKKNNDLMSMASLLDNLYLANKEDTVFLKKIVLEMEKVFISLEQLNTKSLYLVTLYHNFSTCQFELKNEKKGMYCLYKQKQLAQEINDNDAIQSSLIDFGNFYIKKNDFIKGRGYFNKALQLLKAKSPKNKEEIYFALAKSYCTMGDYQQAIGFGEQLLKSNYTINRDELCRVLLVSYNKVGNTQKVAKMLTLYQQAKDSVIKNYISQQVYRQELAYDYQKKIEIDSLKNIQEKRIKNAKIEQQQAKLSQGLTLQIGSVLVILLISIFSFVLYKRFKTTQKQKNIIDVQRIEVTHQKNELTHQKYLVDKKQKEIIDSINYAKRIQEALLKEQDHVGKHLPAHFILYQPKDIIAGDFYWAAEKNNYWYLAVADCTGHGVPGAMMSMLGIAFLNEIIAQEKHVTPAQILDDLRARIIKEMNQTGKEGENKDGMDISLLAINQQTKQCEWAGANNPLWIVRKSKPFSDLPKEEKSISGLESPSPSVRLSGAYELIKVNADKQPIGYYPSMKPFTNNAIQLQENDSLYLFTDGYADQFGGPGTKKLKYKQLEQWLITLQENTLEQQKESLLTNFSMWKGENEQVDDVCIIGIKI